MIKKFLGTCVTVTLVAVAQRLRRQRILTHLLTQEPAVATPVTATRGKLSEAALRYENENLRR